MKFAIAVKSVPAVVLGVALILQVGEGPMQLGPELLALIAGWLLSWSVDNLPGVKERFEALDTMSKSWVFRGLLAIAAVLVVAVGCTPALAGYLGKYVVFSCTEAGLVEVVEAFFFAAIASQGRFQLVTQPAGKAKMT